MSPRLRSLLTTLAMLVIGLGALMTDSQPHTLTLTTSSESQGGIR